MPFNAKSANNLKPFTGKDDSRRQNGRKKGSKNMKTIMRELPDGAVDLSLPIDKTMREYLIRCNNATYAEAITLAMLIKAINGDTRAASLVFERMDDLGVDEDKGFFDKSEIVFQVVPSPYNEPEEYAKFQQWKQYKKETANLE